MWPSRITSAIIPIQARQVKSHRLFIISKKRKAKIISLNTLAPTLEDVFLKLVREEEKSDSYD